MVAVKSDGTNWWLKASIRRRRGVHRGMVVALRSLAAMGGRRRDSTLDPYIQSKVVARARSKTRISLVSKKISACWYRLPPTPRNNGISKSKRLTLRCSGQDKYSGILSMKLKYTTNVDKVRDVWKEDITIKHVHQKVMFMYQSSFGLLFWLFYVVFMSFHWWDVHNLLL
ncbi:unnamed protein product [Lactuca saligna]|uniref:Uncharacterized protein n=1 Tax=Lactuca saligna TaxID=75948 RepID=A0AA35Y820_LACSI|nr:unnamed protein product [Lactuca saligna]